MCEYETLYLLVPDLSAQQVEELNHKLAELIKSHKGHVLTQFNWGKRRLAYRVGKHPMGIYLYLNYLGGGNLVAEIERVLKYDDNVLRFITVKIETEVNVEERLQEKRLFTLTSLDETSEKSAAEASREFV